MSILFYCSDDDNNDILDSLRRKLPHESIEQWPNCENPAAITTAVVWQPPAEFFDGLSSLENVLSIAAGVDHLLQHPGLPDSVNVVRLTDAGMAGPMSDFVLYGVLHAQRRMTELGNAQRAKQWQHNNKPHKASRFRVGILGAGTLGIVSAKRLALNGFPVGCWSRTSKQLDGITHYCGENGFNELLSNSDVLVCLLPLTEQTRHIINGSVLSRLPANAFLINPGRGGHVDEQALLHALNTNQLSGALLDVFETEPLPPNHPFWTHDKVVVTPHVAAPTDIDGAIEQISNSIEELKSGKLPNGLVDRGLGY